MKKFFAIVGCIFCLALTAVPVFAQVGQLENIIDHTVGNAPLIKNVSLAVTLVCPASAGNGACEAAGMLIYGMRQIRVLAAAIAFIIFVVAGFRLVISQSEEAMTTAKRTVLGSVIGLFLIFLIEPIVDSFYGGFTIDPATVLTNATSAQLGARVLSTELMGVLSWIETMVAIVIVGLIVVQAIGVLASFGSEERIKKIYHSVISSVFGVLLIVFDEVIASVFGLTPDATALTVPTAFPLFVEFFGIVRFVLVLVAIIVIGVVIYAGFLMILNFGNEEILNRGKKIFFNALIGLGLIILSVSLVSTVILGIA